MGGSLNRRTLLMLGGAAVALTAAPALAQTRLLRATWWGGQDRLNRTQKAMDAFAATEPGLEIDIETLGSTGDYFVRLATQVAGGNPPDLMQLGYSQIAEYAQRGTLEPLDDYIGNELDIADWPSASVDALRVDGKLYGINLGNNTTTLFYDREGFEKIGAKDIAIDTSWTQWFDMSEEFTKAHDGKVFGLADQSTGALVFENYARQKGFQSYKDGKEIGTPAELAAEWFDMWAKARDRGAIPPPDVAALDTGSVTENLITQGYTGTTFANSNQIVALQGTTPKQLGMAMYPQGAGDTIGQFLRPSQHFSIFSGSKLKSEAVKLANFLVNNPEGVKLLGLERGVPASPSMQDILAPELDDLNRQSLEFVAAVTPLATPIPPAPPKGATEVEAKFHELGQQVAFGQMSAEDAGRSFVEQGNAILARA